MLPTDLDFGLGTFKGEPLVGVTAYGSRFHRHDHHGHLSLDTWTYDYVTGPGSCGIWQPCSVCFPGHPEVPAPAMIDGSEVAE